MIVITNSDKFINVSDVTARVDELREERLEHDKNNGTSRSADGELETLDAEGEPSEGTWEAEEPDDAEELTNLLALLEQLEGRGRGHEWGDNHYPQELIAEYHFSQYVQNFAEECGDISRNASYIVVDWDATANAVRQDYSTVEFDGETYLHRS